MKTKLAIALFALCLSSLVEVDAQITDIFFSAYDPAGENTPFYNTFSVVSDPSLPPFGLDFVQPVSGIVLLDSGWQNPYVQYISQGVNGSPNSSTLRSIGWNQYEFSFDSLTGSESIFMNGNLLVSAPFSGLLTYFYLSYHTVGGSYDSLIQNVSVTENGQTVFQDNFSSSTLNPDWIVERLDPDTFITPGGGELQIGNDGGGNVAATLALDLQTLPDSATNQTNFTGAPEPTTYGFLGAALLIGLAGWRRVAGALAAKFSLKPLLYRILLQTHLTQ